MSGFEDMFPLHSSQEEVENHDKEESETRIVNVSDKRHYTDTGFLILFVATLITMIVLGSYNIHNSQPEILLSGVNDQGQICGFDAAVKSKPYFYSVLTSGIGVCTSSCPAESMQLASTNPNDYYCLHDIVYAGLNTSNYISDNCFTYGQFDISKNCGCMLQLATTTSPLNRCRFSDTPIANQFTTQEFTGPFWTIASDIYKARLIVLAYGVGAPVILSLMYFWIQQSTYFEESFLFFNLSGLIGLFGCLCYFTYTTYQLDDVLLLRVTSTIIVTLLFIILIVIVTQYSNIYKASKIISRSFEFMDTMMPYIFFVPMIKFVSLTAFFVFWVFCIGFTASRCTFTTKTAITTTSSYSYQNVELTSGNGVQLVFFFLCLLWTIDFITAVSNLALSTTVSIWYFHRDENKELPATELQQVKWKEVKEGLYYTMKYHLGTAAFGSLINTLFGLFFRIQSYIETAFFGISTGLITRIIFLISCCKSVTWFKGILFGYSYVQTGIYGYPLFTATDQAQKLLESFDTTFLPFSVVLECLITYNMLLANLIITGFTGLGAFFILAAMYGDDLSSIAAPLLMILLLSSAIVGIFTTLLSTVITTVTQDYIKEKLIHKESPELKKLTQPSKITEFLDNIMSDTNLVYACHWCFKRDPSSISLLRSPLLNRPMSRPVNSSNYDDSWKDMTLPTKEP